MVLIIATFAVSYADRERNVQAVRAQCEQSKPAALDNATSWAVASEQRRRDHDTGTAAAYQSAADSWLQRVARDCHAAYPDAQLVPV